MHPIITATHELLKPGGFDLALCGGFAIELFLNRTVRMHGDVDVSAWWEERDSIILYMQSLGWQVYELCGGGLAHRITDIAQQFRSRRNIFCMTDACNNVALTKTDELDMYQVSFDPCNLEHLTFIEFLFNHRQDGRFLYARNKAISLPLKEAILSRNGIRYLAPELVLLYKSTDPDRPGYQLDYDAAMAALSPVQKGWLYTALQTMYPGGHRWLPAH